MTDSEQSYGEWSIEPGAFVIRYPIALLHEIDFNVKDAARRISHGGMETGGFLFGRTVSGSERETVHIEAFRAIECEHAFGPSFVLSERDLKKMPEQLLQAASDPGLEGMRLLGWFIGHARNPLRLNDHEASLFDRLFPRPGQLTLLMKPERFAPSQIALIVRARDRKVDRDGTKIAFPLPPLLGAPPPLRVEELPEPIPVPAEAAAESPEGVAELPEALELGAPPSQSVKESAMPVPAARERVWVVDDEPAEEKGAEKAVEEKAVEERGAEKVVEEKAAEEKAAGEKTVGDDLARISHTPSVGRSADTAETSLRATSSAETQIAEVEAPVQAPPVPALPNPPASPPRPESTAPTGGAPDGGPEKEIAQNSGLISLDDLRARRLQRLERTERIDQPVGRSEESVAQPPTYALTQSARPPLRVSWPVMAVFLAVMLCIAAYWFREQYFATAVPLEVDDRVDKLMVLWPADATRGGGDATIRVDDATPVPLSPEEKLLGRAEVSRTEDDVQVELVVHHLFFNARGRVRFLKPPITAKP
jgi:hypothetical protein